MNELVEKISMWRNELERQNAHQGINMVFDSICVYLGEQHREIKRLNARETNLRESAEIRGVALEKAEGENQRLMEEIKRWKEHEAEYNKSFTVLQQENERLRRVLIWINPSENKR